MKRFICGVLCGLIIAGTIGVFAASYGADIANFKVLVNGKEFVSDPPALVVNGSTYLPLRAMGEALGVSVNWNKDLNQAEVGNSAPVANVNEYSRDNPAPINTVQTYAQKGYGDMDTTVSVRVLDIARGDKAWETIKSKNQFNSIAPEGYEYILAHIAASVIYTASDRSIQIDSSKFECFSYKNEKYDDVYVDLNDELNKTMYEGGNGEGYLVFCVKKDDATPKTVFCRNYDGTGGIWFALYK